MGECEIKQMRMRLLKLKIEHVEQVIKYLIHKSKKLDQDTEKQLEIKAFKRIKRGIDSELQKLETPRLRDIILHRLHIKRIGVLDLIQEQLEEYIDYMASLTLSWGPWLRES